MLRNKLLSIVLVTIVSCFIISHFSIPCAKAAGECKKEDVVKSIDEAVALLEMEGEAGLAKVGQIRFCGDNYVFVNDFNTVTLMHPKKELIGKTLGNMQDDKGKKFFNDFTQTAMNSQEKDKDGNIRYTGSGWVSYRWPKPGEKDFSDKVTYVKACMMGKKNVYVGAGIYVGK